MPSIRITLVNNVNQKQRSVVVLQLTSATTDPSTLFVQILALAKSKLRLKRPQRIYISRSGIEIKDEDALGAYVASEQDYGREKEIVVSQGEDFVGKKTECDVRERNLVVKVIAEKSAVEHEAVKQLHLTAERCEHITLAVGMPDLHKGPGASPIGCVFVTSARAIYPSLIGGDIGCGMSLYGLSSFSATSSIVSSPTRLASRLPNIDFPYADPLSVLVGANVPSAGPEDDRALGTIGGGNHFAEFQLIDEILDPEAALALGIFQSNVHLLIHSGSRSYGKSILSTAPPTLYSDSEEFASYVQKHDHACAWARVNRDLIAQRLLEPLGHWEKAVKLVDIWHNTVTKKRVETGEKIWIHRKGAAPTDYETDGLNAVVIPGSRGAYSYVVIPRGDQTQNAYSLAHGAGRAIARSRAQNSVHPSTNLTTTSFGSAVICDDKELLYEEAPNCYKDIDAVIEDLKPYITVVARLKPLATYKTRSSSK